MLEIFKYKIKVGDLNFLNLVELVAAWSLNLGFYNY